MKHNRCQLTDEQKLIYNGLRLALKRRATT